MQKLPETPTENISDACAKKRNRTGKGKKPVLFQQWPLGWQHLYLSCCWWRARVRFYVARWLTFPLVAVASVTSNPRQKTSNIGLIKPRLKNTEFGHINPENDKWISTSDLGKTTVLK